MSVSYITSAKTARLQVAADLINSKTLAAATGTASNGSLVIGSASFVNTAGTTGVTTGSTGVLVVIPLPNAGVTVSGTVLNLIASAQSATATGGSGTQAANAAVINNAGVIIIGALTVGGTAEGTATGKDVVLAASTISSGQTVTVNTATVSHAP